jgi:hypothetical protein
MGQSLCIVFDVFSPIFPTGMDKIEYLSIIHIQIRFAIFGIVPPNTQLFKGEIIQATRGRPAKQIGVFYICLPNSSRPVMKIKVILPGNYLQH